MAIPQGSQLSLFVSPTIRLRRGEELATKQHLFVMFLSAGFSHQGCGYSRICHEWQFDGVDGKDKEYRKITDSDDKSRNRTENKEMKKSEENCCFHSIILTEFIVTCTI